MAVKCKVGGGYWGTKHSRIVAKHLIVVQMTINLETDLSGGCKIDRTLSECLLEVAVLPSSLQPVMMALGDYPGAFTRDVVQVGFSLRS